MEILYEKSKFTEEQIALALYRAEDDTPIEEVCRKLGITNVTFYKWRQKYRGLLLTEVRKLKQLEEENKRLKQLVADLSLDKHMLQEVLSKKALKPDVQRGIIDEFKCSYQVSIRRLYQVFSFGKATLGQEGQLTMHL